MKNLSFVIAAVAMLIIEALRPSSRKDEDDDAGLFIGSARPLAAKPPLPKRRR